MKSKKYKLALAVFLGFSFSQGVFAQSQNRTLEEIGAEIHGGSPLSPTADSLVGRYISETGATSIVRRFSSGPGGSDGPQKLAVALGPGSFARFIEHFSSKNLFIVHHTPNSGTFYFFYKGRLGSYARTTQAAAFAAPGTLVIPILLDDEEAERLENFLALASIHNGYARSPWTLTGSSGSYSGTSAFQGCTNWVGQMPIGSTMVEDYVFPSGDNGSNPIVQRLRPYDTPSGFTPEQERVLRSVWQVPGYQQFGDMLYPAGHRMGDFTNIGWVAHVALGTLDLDRAPVMFYEVNDHRAALSPTFPLFTSPY